MFKNTIQVDFLIIGDLMVVKSDGRDETSIYRIERLRDSENPKHFYIEIFCRRICQ